MLHPLIHKTDLDLHAVGALMNRRFGGVGLVDGSRTVEAAVS